MAIARQIKLGNQHIQKATTSITSKRKRFKTINKSLLCKENVQLLTENFQGFFSVLLLIVASNISRFLKEYTNDDIYDKNHE